MTPSLHRGWITRPLGANFGTDEEFAAALAALGTSADTDTKRVQRRRDRERSSYWQRVHGSEPPPRSHPSDAVLRDRLDSIPSCRIREGALVFWCPSCCRYAPPASIVCQDCREGRGPSLPSTYTVSPAPGTLATVRRSRGWTQPQIGAAWGISPQMVSMIEGGGSRARIWWLRQLSRLTGWSLVTTLRRLGVDAIYPPRNHSPLPYPPHELRR